jgi:hypothetical protein
MNDMNRGIDPAQAFVALQQYAANEAARFYTEIAMRDAYIKQLEEAIQELEKKVNGQG